MKKRIFVFVTLVLVFALFGSAFAYAATKTSTTSYKKTVTINWSNPQDIAYGVKLSNTQLNATATYNGVAVSGTYAYSPSSGTLLSPGSQQTLKVTFTPSNNRVYNTAYKEVKINVLNPVIKITPVINWTTPADIVAGTALSSTQFNAVATYNGASIPGTFSYSPTAGTILSAGSSQTLKVTFSPTDTTKYTTAYKEVKINVLAPSVTTPSTSSPVELSGLSVKDYGATANDSTDDTAAIQNAINKAYSNGGGTVSVPDGQYLINPDVSIRMKSNVKLMLSTNAVLKATPSKNTSYYVILMWDVSNAEVTGGKIIGERNEHLGTTGEWGHGIAIRGCNNIHISDISVSDCWGDGIYIGSSDNQYYCNNVTVERYNLDNNRRQGISVISAKNLLLKDGVISNTNGIAPGRGIDFEPNRSWEFMQDVVVENLRTYNNEGTGIGFWLANIFNTTEEVSITIKNYVDSGSMSAFNGQLTSSEFTKNNVVIL